MSNKKRRHFSDSASTYVYGYNVSIVAVRARRFVTR